jgi:hypothetical protein
MSDEKHTIVVASPSQLFGAKSRREFLRLMSVGGTAVFLPSMFAGCDDDRRTITEIAPGDPALPNTVTLDLSNDTGILNYAFALEQMEAAFYEMVVQNFGGSNLSQAEQDVLNDIKEHEVIYREFYRAALGAAGIPNLETDFSLVNFNDRLSVLETATTFEDTGTYAYNGAGKYLTDPQNLLVAGKIVSVKARQAAALRDLLKPGTAFFAGDDTVNADGLDMAFEPDVVLHAADPFIRTIVRIGTPPSA